MSSHEDAQVDRLDAAMRRFYATHRRSLRWWKHAREYVSLLRLVKNGLLKERVWSEPGEDTDYRMVMDPATPAKDGLPSHPKWPEHPHGSGQPWRWNTPDGKAPFRY